MKQINPAALKQDLATFRDAIQTRSAAQLPGLIGSVLKDFLMGLEGDPGLLTQVLELFNSSGTTSPLASPSWPPQPPVTP